MFAKTAAPMVTLFTVALLSTTTHAYDLTWQGCAVSKTAFMEVCADAYERQTGFTIRLVAGTTELGIEATAASVCLHNSAQEEQLVEQHSKVIAVTGRSNARERQLVKAYQYLPPTSQICSFERLQSQSSQVFTNQSTE